MAAQQKDDQGKWFATTSWTMVEDAKMGSRQALERLCSLYWYPLYAYARGRGRSPQDAEDLTQGFFFELLEKNFFHAADRQKGKFRSFLLVSCRYFLDNQRKFEQAQKRGGDVPLVSLDNQTPEERFCREPSTDMSPEKLFDRHWAQTIIQQAQELLREEYREKGQLELFDQLKPFLMESTGKEDYIKLAETLAMRPNTVAVAVHRLRDCYGRLVRKEIARTVSSPSDVSSEMKHFFEVLTG